MVEWKLIESVRCPKCDTTGSVYYRVIESSCGSYTDEQYECMYCEYSWWIEGPDY